MLGNIFWDKKYVTSPTDVSTFRWISQSSNSVWFTSDNTYNKSLAQKEPRNKQFYNSRC